MLVEDRGDLGRCLEIVAFGDAVVKQSLGVRFFSIQSVGRERKWGAFPDRSAWKEMATTRGAGRIDRQILLRMWTGRSEKRRKSINGVVIDREAREVTRSDIAASQIVSGTVM